MPHQNAKYEYNGAEIVIVGAGPSGLTAALYAEKLGLDYVLIEKSQFPKDKICGDAFAPCVFDILDELHIDISKCVGVVKPSFFRFLFNSEQEQAKHQSQFSEEDKMLNIQRIYFDNFLYQELKNKNRIINAKVTDIIPDQNFIQIESEDSSYKMSYNHLIVATGSGKRLLSTQEENKNIILASRIYLHSETNQLGNLIKFEESIAPGYFWAFPVEENKWNTGILLHDKSQFNDIYAIHFEQLKLHFENYDILSKDKYPLRISSNCVNENRNNIAFIGDANHSIDALLGHGIDAGMLEAREQILSIFYQKSLVTNSKILSLIEKKNTISNQTKKQLQDTTSQYQKLETFGVFMHELTLFYTEIKNEISANNQFLNQKMHYQKTGNSKNKWSEKFLDFIQKLTGNHGI